MPQDQPKRRFLSMLRRTAKSAQVKVAGRSAQEENALWTSHDRAVTATKEASSAAQRISSNVARQRGAVDAVADRARAVTARAQELTTSLARIADAFEKLGMIALNAGLEGARLGETAGRALLIVSDEVKAHASRGSETARDVSAATAEVVSELAQLASYVGQARETTADVAQEAARAAGSCTEAEGALLDIGEKLRKATGSDPETVRAIAETAENARALVNSLTTLSGKVPRNLLLSALRPMLDPLARLLAEEDHTDDAGDVRDARERERERERDEDR
jgi:methyl-accepting chemotaxis protein